MAMNTVTTTTFDVSDVKRATEPLPEIPYKEAVEALLTVGISDFDRQMIDKFTKQGIPLAQPDPPPYRPVEACDRYHGRLLGGVSFHPVVAAVHHAFMDHRPLRFSPDTIWLMICQAVANHINAHAEELRHRFVAHEGKALISVKRDDFVKGSPENPWAEVIDGFCGLVREHVGPSIDLFLPAFTTTGPVERAAAGVVLLDAIQSYFTFVLRTLCGIPAITLEGTMADWESLAQRTEEFIGFGLERWVEVLRPILRQFVRASTGDVDAVFWRSLYKLNDQSGGPVITGWITSFFPYLKDHRSGRATHPVEKLLVGEKVAHGPSAGQQRQRWFVHGPTMECFPGGLSKAPFRWNYLDLVFDMEFLGGFVGVSQEKATLAVKPEIGWAVRETLTRA
jgi:hypothetical protein